MQHTLHDVMLPCQPISLHKVSVVPTTGGHICLALFLFSVKMDVYVEACGFIWKVFPPWNCINMVMYHDTISLTGISFNDNLSHNSLSHNSRMMDMMIMACYDCASGPKIDIENCSFTYVNIAGVTCANYLIISNFVIIYNTGKQISWFSTGTVDLEFNSLRPSDAYMRQQSYHHWFR